MTAEPVRMTQTTRAVLRAVASAGADGERVWAAQLTRDHLLDANTVTAVLHRLAARGWLRREMEAGDPSVLRRPLRALYGFTPDGARRYEESLPGGES